DRTLGLPRAHRGLAARRLHRCDRGRWRAARDAGVAVLRCTALAGAGDQQAAVDVRDAGGDGQLRPVRADRMAAQPTDRGRGLSRLGHRLLDHPEHQPAAARAHHPSAAGRRRPLRPGKPAHDRRGRPPPREQHRLCADRRGHRLLRRLLRSGHRHFFHRQPGRPARLRPDQGDRAHQAVQLDQQHRRGAAVRTGRQGAVAARLVHGGGRDAGRLAGQPHRDEIRCAADPPVAGDDQPGDDRTAAVGLFRRL
ncbi:MAG: Transmembrane protein YfcA, partial [uncultured Sphingomonas sp.]